MSRFVRAVAGVVVVLAFAGCAALADVVALSSDLDKAGYVGTSVSHNTVNGYSLLRIETSRPDRTPTEADGDEVAELVWTTYAGEFDRLRVVLNDELMVNKDVDELRAQFGDRPAGLSELTSDNSSNVILIVVVVVIALAFAGLMVLVWHRGRRRAAQLMPPPNPYQPPARW